MGHFSEEDLKRSYDREDIEQVEKEQGDSLNSGKDKSLQQRLELEKKMYFARYGNNEKARLYEYEDEQQEETDDLSYGR